jgi:hypothetical protein
LFKRVEASGRLPFAPLNETRAQCYKTFIVRDLQIFVLS